MVRLWRSSLIFSLGLSCWSLVPVLQSAHISGRAGEPKLMEPEQRLFYPPHLLTKIEDVWKIQSREDQERYWVRTQQSVGESRQKNAYVTLLHGLILDTSKYRRYLVCVLIAKQALEAHNSTADHIVIVGFGSSNVSSDPRVLADLRLLEEQGVLIRYIPGVWFENEDTARRDVGFVEITVSKIFAWSLIEYKRVQMIDADIMPLNSMDCFFETDQQHVFVPENSAPINAGWILLQPNYADFFSLYQLASWRLQLVLHRKPFLEHGWGPCPVANTIPGLLDPKMNCNWRFAGGDLDQGLLVYYFYQLKGSLAIFPSWNPLKAGIPGPKDSIRVVKDFEGSWEPLSEIFPSCDESRHHPKLMVKHFFIKPWARPEHEKRDLHLYEMWFAALDALQIPGVTSKNVEEYFTEFDERN